MDDLISRQAAIDAIEKAMCEDGFRSSTGLIHKTTAYEIIRHLPSAQPERKKGKWINANDGKWNTVEVLKCSACGELDNRMYRTDNYCPNCGADMRGEDDE